MAFVGSSKIMEYVNFDLLVDSMGKDKYQVRVVESPSGQATSKITMPLSPMEIENFILKTGLDRGNVRSINELNIDKEYISDFGSKLFTALFSGDIESCFRTSYVSARNLNKGLRIRLRLSNAPELIDVPWELLFDTINNRFIGLSINTPIIRTLDIPKQIDTLKLKGVLRVLVMVSNPTDYPALDVNREWDRIQEATASLQDKGLIILERLSDSSLSCLQRALRKKDFHIFHFIGHGYFDKSNDDGMLILEENENNKNGKKVSGSVLGTLLHDSDSIRLAILNSCNGARTSLTDPFAGVAQSLLQQGIPAVIAMQFEITDKAAITFAQEFYLAIVDGYPVDAAVAESRKMIYSSHNEIEWATPVLYLSSNNTQVFDYQYKRVKPDKEVDNDTKGNGLGKGNNGDKGNGGDGGKISEHKTAIAVALITLVGVVVSALIANPDFFNKLFPQTPPPIIKILGDHNPPRIVREKDNNKVQNETSAPLVKDLLWPQESILNVYFMDGDKETISFVKNTLKEWRKYINIQFKHINSKENSDIRVSFKVGGNWSFIGIHANSVSVDEATVGLGSLKSFGDEDIMKRAVLHEFGHVLGLIHEYQTPNALEQIDWGKAYDYFSKTASWSKAVVDNNFKKRIISTTEYLRKPYDPSSIMGYLLPDEILKTPIAYSIKGELSEADIAFISKLYPRKQNPSSDLADKLSIKSLAPTKQSNTDSDADNRIMLTGQCEPEFGEIQLYGLKQKQITDNTSGLITVKCNSERIFTYPFNHAEVGISAVKGAQIFGDKSAIWYKERKFGASNRGNTILLDAIPYSVNGIKTADRQFTLVADCKHSSEIYQVSFEGQQPIDADCDNGKLKVGLHTYGGAIKKIIIKSPGGAIKKGLWWSGIKSNNGQIKFSENPPPGGFGVVLNPLDKNQFYDDEDTGLTWLKALYLLGVTSSLFYKAAEKEVWEKIETDLESICTIKPCLRIANLSEVQTMLKNLGNKKLADEFTSLRSFTGAFNIMGLAKRKNKYSVYGVQTTIDSNNELKERKPDLINTDYKINDVGIWLVKGN